MILGVVERLRVELLIVVGLVAEFAPKMWLGHLFRLGGTVGTGPAGFQGPWTQLVPYDPGMLECLAEELPLGVAIQSFLLTFIHSSRLDFSCICFILKVNLQ